MHEGMLRDSRRGESGCYGSSDEVPATDARQIDQRHAYQAQEEEKKLAFNRVAFKQIVASRSPLRPDQIDKLCGGIVDGYNKRLAWQLINLQPQFQFTLWSVIQAFPEAVIERVK